MMSTCHVCRIILSAHDMSTHVLGKRHQKNANKDVLFNHGKATEKQKEVNKEATPVLKIPKSLKNETAKKVRQKRKLKAVESSPTTTVDPKTDVPPAQINKSLPFERQVEHFIAQIRQTEQERYNIQLVLKDVAFTFSKVIPDVMPLLYGSQLTGLAFKTSDIDVYLSDPRGRVEDDAFIRRHGRIIYKTNLFTNIVMITRARVPVIKAKHICTGIELDISATSGQAVANSVLIRFLLSHDPRISKLMMLIGYWAKKSNLICIGKFSRYSFNLLVIFYLQNLVKPIIPPLRKIVYGVPGKTWPFHVIEDKRFLINENTDSIQELFIGFFDFYHAFPFARYVISTYLGRRILFTDLIKEEILSEMIYYRVHLDYNGEHLFQKNICIQDPLELSHNTSKAITERTLVQFDKSCKKMLEMGHRLHSQDWLYEILNGTVAQPIVIEKPTKDLTVRIPYQTKPKWAETFKKNLCDVLTFVGFTISHNVPSDDNKKTKLSPDCFQFLLETTWAPNNNDYKKLVYFLKASTLTLDEFKSQIKPGSSDASCEKDNFLFSALLFLKKLHTDAIVLAFSNKGEVRHFHKTAYGLIKCMDLLVTLKVEGGILKDNPEFTSVNKQHVTSSTTTEVKTSQSNVTEVETTQSDLTEVKTTQSNVSAESSAPIANQEQVVDSTTTTPSPSGLAEEEVTSSNGEN